MFVLQLSNRKQGKAVISVLKKIKWRIFGNNFYTLVT